MLKHAHPPRPDYVLSVGITGHRPNRLRPQEIDEIREKIAACLSVLKNTLEGKRQSLIDFYSQRETRIVLYTGLAEGVDRLGAKCALDQGFQLSCILPFFPDEFELDFQSTESKAEFRSYLTKASSTIEFPGNRKEGARVYERAGFAMLEQVSILIAVFDGNSNGGRGGTKALIDEAARRGLPIIVIPTEQGATPRGYWHALSPSASKSIVFDDLQPFPIEAAVAKIIETTMSPPQENTRTSIAERYPLEEYLREKVRRVQLRPEWALLQGLAGVRAPSITRSPPPHWRDVTAQALNERTDSPKSIIERAFTWSDAIAIHYSNVFRSAIVANFLFAGLSVLIAAISLFTQKTLHLMPDGKAIFISIELISIFIVLLNTKAGQKLHWHDKWLEAREIAERLRLAKIARDTGQRLFPSFASYPTWSSWYYSRICFSDIYNNSVLSPSFLALKREELLFLLRDQTNYHKQTLKRLSSLNHRLELFGEILFWMTVACSALYLFFDLATHVTIGAEAGFAVTSLTLSLPVIATVAYGIRVLSDLEGGIQRSQRMSRQLDNLILAMESDDPKSVDAVRWRIQQAADVMLADVAAWRISSESRALAIPG